MPTTTFSIVSHFSSCDGRIFDICEKIPEAYHHCLRFALLRLAQRKCVVRKMLRVLVPPVVVNTARNSIRFLLKVKASDSPKRYCLSTSRGPGWLEDLSHQWNGIFDRRILIRIEYCGITEVGS